MFNNSLSSSNNNSSSSSMDLDWIEASIKTIADDIEYAPSQVRAKVSLPEQSSPKKLCFDQMDLEKPSEVGSEAHTDDSDSSPKMTQNIEVFDQCNFKTRQGGMKEYQISIANNELVFERPSSSHQSLLSYTLNKIQCVKSTNLREDEFYCLQLILSKTHQRCIYFTSEAAQEYWHTNILQEQGFLNTRISQYEPIKKLGQGSFGRVILAKHQFSGAEVAIKFIAKSEINKAFKANGQDFIELELSEKLTKLDCDNLLRTFETFEDKDNFVIVTEYVKAGDLFKYVCKQPDQPLTEEHAKNALKQIATGLKQLHARNVIHRDIKMENILASDFTDKATFKLADFGSAHQLVDETDKADF